jgi:hypothetical protein
MTAVPMATDTGLNGGLSARHAPSSHCIRSSNLSRALRLTSRPVRPAKSIRAGQSPVLAASRRRGLAATPAAKRCASGRRDDCHCNVPSLPLTARRADGPSLGIARVLRTSLTSASAHRRGRVSVRVSDRLDAIAYPNAATVAAIDLDVLRYRRPGPIHLVGATEGGTAHLLVARVKIRICSRLINFWSLSALTFASQALSSILPRGWVLSSTVDRKGHVTPSSSQHHQATQAR